MEGDTMNGTQIKLDDFTKGYIQAALWSSTAGAYYCPECDEHYSQCDELPLPPHGMTKTCTECGTAVTDSDHSFEQMGNDRSDLAPETLAAMIADCERFRRENKRLLESIGCARGSGEYSQDEQAGHDFWLTRNDHGAGFWDGDWTWSGDVDDEVKAAGDPGKLLSARCGWRTNFPEVDLYYGDDGLIYS